jgi:hypothetical protein
MPVNTWYVLLLTLAILALPPSIYGLHRLCVWLEDRGWLYYHRKRSSSTAAGCFVALQQVLEPPVRHVHELKTQRPAAQPGIAEPTASKESTPS